MIGKNKTCRDVRYVDSRFIRTRSEPYKVDNIWSQHTIFHEMWDGPKLYKNLKGIDIFRPFIFKSKPPIKF